MNDEETLSFECELEQPPAQVWRALTEPALLAQWLLPNDFAPEPGHEFTFREADGDIECTVLEVERERSLRLRWRDQELDSVVTFTLSPAIGGGTHLRLDHGGVERLRSAVPALACANDAAQMAALIELYELVTQAPRKRKIGFALDGDESVVEPEFAPLDPARIPLRSEPLGFERTVEHEAIRGSYAPSFRCAA